MKMTLILFLVALVFACDAQSTTEESEATGVVPTKEEIKKEVKDGAKDALKKRGPKWKFTYSGDLKGEVEGTIATAVPGPFTVAIAGSSLKKDRKGTAPQKVSGSIVTKKDEGPRAMLTLHLEDGTKCVTKPEMDSPMLDTEVVDSNKKTYHAKFKGTMYCGEKKIQVDGWLRKKL